MESKLINEKTDFNLFGNFTKMGFFVYGKLGYRVVMCRVLSCDLCISRTEIYENLNRRDSYELRLIIVAINF